MSGLAQPRPAFGPDLDTRRLLAALVDMVLLIPAGAVIVAMMGGLTPSAQVLIGAWALYYYFALESGAGQTLGKRLLGIRVVREDGGPADMRRVALRTILRVVDGFGAYLVGLIVMLITGERRQRLGDLAAGTVVASAESPSPRAPVADPGPEPEPVSGSEPAVPVVELPPMPELDPAEDDLAEPEPEEDEPVVEEPPAAEEPVEPEPDENHGAGERLEIVSSPIELVMAEDDPVEDSPDAPADTPDEPQSA